MKTVKLSKGRLEFFFSNKQIVIIFRVINSEHSPIEVTVPYRNFFFIYICVRGRLLGFRYVEYLYTVINLRPINMYVNINDK